ncbi:TetR/AcrR family transcriptional regulator [Georgenia faecalis]|uniref:TetR/AcrR family transcriptional regulator n=1 Tax=Georgenia faecalis TaxID=2483799 RepID=A0ABV9D926_9MICO|nr:TetR/AcrR family transcriptional regulator [Georgenia faecalis]
MSDQEQVGAADLPPGMAVLWRASETGSRGPRRALSRAKIAEAGVALADADGLDGLSMARLARRLGVTTMALYRYVASKDELYALMYDAAVGAPPDAATSGSWRAELEAWCTEQVGAIAQHPWLMELVTLSAMGPNRVAWIERGLRALEPTGLSQQRRAAVIGMLALHVLSEGQVVASFVRQQRGVRADHPALADFSALLGAVTDPVQYPAITAALAAGAFSDDGSADGAVSLSLTLLLDGVERLVEREGG